MANDVEQEETVLNIRFVKLDCSPLKSSLVQHCSDWQSRLTHLLSHMASNRLKELHASLQDNAKRWGVKSKKQIVQTSHNVRRSFICDGLG